MIGGIEVKVCGLTRREDAQLAKEIGADYIGFIFYPKSPRYVSLEKFETLIADLPDLPKVAVTVAPDERLIASLQDFGFEHFQIHYSQADTQWGRVQEWSNLIGKGPLWLAPKKPPEDGLDESVLSLADSILWDAYRKDAFGGTGQTSDWSAFASMQSKYPEKNWVLAGGLGPENVSEAVAETGARRLDFNSGVEISPGIKDRNRLMQVRDELARRSGG